MKHFEEDEIPDDFELKIKLAGFNRLVKEYEEKEIKKKEEPKE